MREPETLAVLDRGFFAREATKVARDLVGARLLVASAGGTIVETEAYAADDPASHSYRGPTARNAAHVRARGARLCLPLLRHPLVPEPGLRRRASGSAVLIRALAPTDGLASMRARRGTDEIRQLCAGPGRLCQALGVTDALDGLALDTAPFAIALRPAPVEIVVGPRIGITRAVDTPWRFGLRGSPFASRSFGHGPRS